MCIDNLGNLLFRVGEFGLGIEVLVIVYSVQDSLIRLVL